MPFRLPNLFLLVTLFCLVQSAAIQAQSLVLPPASPPAQLRQQVGLTDIELRYNRPHVKGRLIFGSLVPYGQLWRTGANEASLLRFSRPVRIGDQTVEAGTYSLYTIPGPQQWTWILNRDTSLWGERGYQQRKDVLRRTAEAEALSDRVETMELRLMNVTPQSVDLVLEWEYTRVRLPIALATDEQVQALIDRQLGPTAGAEDYYRAARYYLDNGLDLQKAHDWMEKRVEMGGEQFGILRYKALIEHGLGDTATARRTLERSLTLARETGNDHYVRMNERTLQEWRRRPVTLSGADIVRRSIAYHDPEGRWAKSVVKLQLYEERPGSSYRITDLVLDQPGQSFTLSQRRGRDHIYRYSGPDGCEVKINGEDKMFVEAMEINALRCRDNERIRDFYTYLWSLPMKLNDPGTIIAPTVVLRDFFGRELYEVKVTYEAEVGSDTWYFYFDPQTFALSGYRFYHDESKNDGEYILLSGELEADGLRLPAQRKWYANENQEYLGMDELRLVFVEWKD